MDWLVWVFSDPFDHDHSMLAYLAMVLIASIVVALWMRRTEWLSATVLAPAVSAAAFFVMYTSFQGIGPLSLLGLGMLFVWGWMVAIPTVGLIRLLMRWILGKPERAE